MTENYFTVPDGLRLFYREFGDAQNTNVIVCLPGLTRNSLDFVDLARHLASKHRVICPDLRGRGQSDRDPDRSRYHPGTYVSDVLALLAHLGIQRLAIVGTSLGGLIGLAIAASYPDRLRGLILNDIGPEIDPVGVSRIMGYVGKPVQLKTWEQTGQHVQNLYGVTMSDKDEGFWVDFARRSFREVDGRIEPNSDPGIGDNLRNPSLIQRIVQWLNKKRVVRKIRGIYLDPWDSFRVSSCPILVLRGEHSDILSAQTVAAMEQEREDVLSVVIPDRGHTPLLDEPEAITAIDGFLDRVFP